MKSFLILICCVALGVQFSGCGETHGEAQATAVNAEVQAARYKEGHGIALSPEAIAFIALTTAEMQSRDIGPASGVGAIPRGAILHTVRGDFVFVVNGEWYLRTPVTLGRNDGDWYEVVDGLYEGDTVVTHGTEALWLAEIQAVNGGVGCADGH